MALTPPCVAVAPVAVAQTAGEQAFRYDAWRRLKDLRPDRQLFVQTALVNGGVLVNAALSGAVRTSEQWRAGELTIASIQGSRIRTETYRLGPDIRHTETWFPAAPGTNVRVIARARSLVDNDAIADLVLDLVPHLPAVLGQITSYRRHEDAVTPAPEGTYRPHEVPVFKVPLHGRIDGCEIAVVDRAEAPVSAPFNVAEEADRFGNQWLTIELPRLPGGDYAIDVTVRAHGDLARRRFAFRVQ